MNDGFSSSLPVPNKEIESIFFPSGSRAARRIVPGPALHAWSERTTENNVVFGQAYGGNDTATDPSANENGP